MADRPPLREVKLWDPLLRGFHWLLAFFVTAAWLLGNYGPTSMTLHFWCGYAVAFLLAFRLIWGFVGSTHVRFMNFWPKPSSIRAYLRGDWHGIGHNPLGALSVVALLALIGLQVVTGLFSNDDIAFNGPLRELISNTIAHSQAHRVDIRFELQADQLRLVRDCVIGVLVDKHSLCAVRARNR